MKKFHITVNGNAYEVEVEEIGAAAPAAAPAAPVAAAAGPAAAAEPVEEKTDFDVELTDAEYAVINEALGGIAIYGDRDGKDIKKLGTVPDNVNK